MSPVDLDNVIQALSSGDDTSIDAASSIEVALDDRYPGDDYIQQTVEMLAMHRPGGGEMLFDVDAIRARLIETREYLRGR